MQIGARVMELNDAHVLCGAIYPFTLFGGRALQEKLRALSTLSFAHEQDVAPAVGLSDVKGSREAGWDRLTDSEDGLTRSQATVSPQPGGKRVSLLYKAATLADQGRPWFEALAGASAARPGPSLQPPEGLDPQELVQALAAVVRRSYANWAGEPIPALGGRTPRRAITDPAGLERVKGLLRSDEDGEARNPAQQRRAGISCQFLWDALGLQR